MTTDLFKKDYRQLTAQGVKFTPEDIVRLNALAVKVSLSRRAASNAHLLRLAFLPPDSWWRTPLILREPTIAHELWLAMVERWIDTSRGANFLFLHAFALSRRPVKLPDPERPKMVVREVFGFAAKRLAKFTNAQLSAAVEYVLFGADWKTGEHGPAKPVSSAPSPTEEEGKASTVLGLIAESRAIRLPITLAESRQMTASELAEAILLAKRKDGTFDDEKSYHQAMGEYVRARNEIRARSMKDQPTDR